jgi:hypothetical protein
LSVEVEAIRGRVSRMSKSSSWARGVGSTSTVSGVATECFDLPGVLRGWPGTATTRPGVLGGAAAEGVGAVGVVWRDREWERRISLGGVMGRSKARGERGERESMAPQRIQVIWFSYR